MNPFHVWNQPNAGGAPSIFGALPYPKQPPNLHKFYFTYPAGGSIMNSTVVNAAGAPQLSLGDRGSAGYTKFQNPQGQTVALVEWQRYPRVEILYLLPVKQDVRNWLRVNSDGNFRWRTMEIQGRQCMFAPHDQFIYIYLRDASGVRFMGKISRSPSSVLLETTQEAISLGLLNAVIVTTFLLQCGRNID
ncbi:hypothetical protein FISHEDRAFT_74599 [Fistulina hepatica ATCC 64428]|uniref:Uncharacterized protein n=1 Tax=Fistulina hepatica ATCC 64428 TaxID=1128425 RepID=A0A0D7AAQ7_9AGAR|nr:hypothetical protein FISHEDRAFT_74599 [Fistulina hepatica ATCC 64428]